MMETYLKSIGEFVNFQKSEHLPKGTAILSPDVFDRLFTKEVLKMNLADYGAIKDIYDSTQSTQTEKDGNLSIQLNNVNPGLWKFVCDRAKEQS